VGNRLRDSRRSHQVRGNGAVHRAKREGGLYSHNHLLAAQKRVTDELARAQCHGGIDVRHLCDCDAEDRSIFCKVDGEGGWRFKVDFLWCFLAD
jgi:hypothetical protein